MAAVGEGRMIALEAHGREIARYDFHPERDIERIEQAVLTASRVGRRVRAIALDPHWDRTELFEAENGKPTRAWRTLSA